ncbi:MAG TPA: hypothetical protein VEA99_02685, partial [Gemmatimonadaceae bacterium]|nr:hypothetical protein [Gemmatimonadaceae bacterium]
NASGTEPVPVHVHVDDIPGAQVICEAFALGSAESRMVPLVVRVPLSTALARTIPFHVRVTAPHAQVEVDATFKTGGQLASVPSAD